MVSEGWLMESRRMCWRKWLLGRLSSRHRTDALPPGLAAASLACVRLPERIAGEGKLARKMIGCALGADVPFVWVAGGAMGQPQRPASSSTTPPGRWRTPSTTAAEASHAASTAPRPAIRGNPAPCRQPGPRQRNHVAGAGDEGGGPVNVVGGCGHGAA